MTENRDRRLLDAYQALRKVLMTVFILPIELPELRGGYFRPGESQRKVVHARSILRDMPANSHRRDLVDQLILDWLNAMVMTRMSKVEPWCGDAADEALTRFQATLEVLRYEDE